MTEWQYIAVWPSTVALTPVLELGQVPCLGSPLACSYSPSGWRLPNWAYFRSALCYYMVRVRPDPWILHCVLTEPPEYLYVFQH